MRLKKPGGQLTAGFFFIPTHPAQKVPHYKFSESSFQQTFVLL